MTAISAIIHTLNHGRCVGRAIESLHTCEEIVVCDGGSGDDTLAVAQRFGARVVRRHPQMVASLASDWVLCLLPSEALVEDLETSLYEWKLNAPSGVFAFTVHIREEAPGGWRELAPEVRLVHRDYADWHGGMPKVRRGTSAASLRGHLARLHTASPPLSL